MYMPNEFKVHYHIQYEECILSQSKSTITFLSLQRHRNYQNQRQYQNNDRSSDGTSFRRVRVL